MLWDINHPGRSDSDFLRPAANPTSTPDDIRGSSLTDRELQILPGNEPRSLKQTHGHKRFLSEDTIKTYARRVSVKLGARDRARPVALGLRTGLLT